jgi:hypothetical protein
LSRAALDAALGYEEKRREPNCSTSPKLHEEYLKRERRV